jgi:xanthine dehydrogenase molybdopterin-binding subunit B/xanthine dehydrogenase iron-sulfur cluster and FAD-binding subunit A
MSSKNNTPSPATPPSNNHIVFFLNGDQVQVPLDEARKWTLARWLRERTKFTGTKIGCAQGGCGACTIAITRGSASTRETDGFVPAASCLFPLVEAHGREIRTVEGLVKSELETKQDEDSKSKGGGCCRGRGGKPHPIQQRLAEFHGTQCGFCTPGMVMAMFGHLNRSKGGEVFESEKDLENEDVLAGNICRCTGYRPINSALKSFSIEGKTKDYLGNVTTKMGPYDTKKCDPDPIEAANNLPAFPDTTAMRPETISIVVRVWRENHDKLLVVAGHTGHGVFGDEFQTMHRKKDTVLHLRGVPEMKQIDTTTSKDAIIIGACATIAQLIESLDSRASASEVAKGVMEHASLIAGHQVRNVGTVGGNIMMCRTKGFASDLAPLLSGAGAMVDFAPLSGDIIQNVPLYEFLNSKEPVILLKITLPTPSSTFTAFKSYRTAMRSRNAYSILNAAYRINFNEKKEIVSSIIIVGALGGGKLPIRCTALEKELGSPQSNKLFSDYNSSDVEHFKSTCNKIMTNLSEEHFPIGEEHSEYRERLMKTFFMKFLSYLGNKAEYDGGKNKFQGGRTPLHGKGTRSSTSVQHYDTYENDQYAPAFVPTTKTSGIGQTIGSIRYTADVTPGHSLFGAYISAPFPGAKYEGNVASLLSSVSVLPGEIFPDIDAIIGYQDIVKHNFKQVIDWGNLSGFGGPAPKKEDGTDPANDEYVFLPPGEPSSYDGQPVAIVLCRTQLDAERAAKVLRKTIHWKGAGAGSAGSVGGVATKEETKGSENSSASTSSNAVKFTLANMPTFDPKQMEVLLNRNGEDATIQSFLEKAEQSQDGLVLVEGIFDKKSQQHFYMETQRTLTIPDDDGVLVCYASAQGMNATHKIVSRMLNIKSNLVVVKLRRVGGGFGGKLSRGIPNSVRSAMCASILGKPVLLTLTRENDMEQVGGREEMYATWRVAAEKSTGKIKAIDVDMMFGAGETLDGSRFNAGMFGGDFDSVYELPQARCTLTVKKGWAPARTAVRTPVHLETVLFMESIMDKIGIEINMDNALIRESNFVQSKMFKQLGVKPVGREAIAPGPMWKWSLPAVWEKCKINSKYDVKVQEIKKFNAEQLKSNGHKRRGVGIAPGKYTCFRVIHTGMRVRINILDDASIQVSTGGAEIGQGLLTKVGQCVCSTLSEILNLDAPLDMDMIRFREHDSGHNPSQGNAGGSTTSEAAVHAAEKACKELAFRLKPWKKGSNNFQKIVENAKNGLGGLPGFWHKVDFDVNGFYLPPVEEGLYPVFGSAVTEVEIDIWTGETKVLSTHILMDSGKSLNPAIDIGQVEGAFVMGLGQVLLEKVLYDENNGKLKTNNTWTYKPPGINDIPENFTVELLDFSNQRVDNGFRCVFTCLRKLMKCIGKLKNPTTGAARYRSNRAMGEPPMMTVTSIGSALRNAIFQVRGGDNQFNIPVPCTPEDVARLCGNC